MSSPRLGPGDTSVTLTSLGELPVGLGRQDSCLEDSASTAQWGGDLGTKLTLGASAQRVPKVS